MWFKNITLLNTDAGSTRESSPRQSNEALAERIKDHEAEPPK